MCKGSLFCCLVISKYNNNMSYLFLLLCVCMNLCRNILVKKDRSCYSLEINNQTHRDLLWLTSHKCLCSGIILIFDSTGRFIQSFYQVQNKYDSQNFLFLDKFSYLLITKIRLYFLLLWQAKGLGYAMNTSEEINLVKEISKATGVILDPVYRYLSLKCIIYPWLH